MQEVLETAPAKVTADMRARLDAVYTEEEVKKALFQMYPTKAPGPDGFTSEFLRACWDTVKHDICDAFDKLYHLKAWASRSLMKRLSLSSRRSPTPPPR